MFRCLLPWLFALLALPMGVAQAQMPAPPSTAAPALDPTRANVPVPPALHRSAFAGYRRQADAAPIAWRDANDNVAQIGGWRAYAREAAAPAPAASAPPAGRAP